MTDLDKLEALERAATRARLFECYCKAFAADGNDDGTIVFEVPCEAGDTPTTQGLHDLRFLIAVWNNAPAMIQELRELRAFRDRMRGPVCTDQTCPDHDGEHPFHLNACVIAHEKAQEPFRATVDALRAEVEGLKAQLATAREALEEARHSIEHTYFCQNDSAETGCTCNALYAQNKIANALKKTTKGGGA